MSNKAETETNSKQYNLINHNILIVWKPEYDLRIPIIDEQHRGIVSTINSLFYGMQNNYGASLLRPVIGMVKEYTYIHFRTEEDFLKKHNFPEVKQHQALHNGLRIMLEKVGKNSLWNKNPYEFLEFLKEWWINHICQKDREFRDYLLKNFP